MRGINIKERFTRHKDNLKLKNKKKTIIMSTIISMFVLLFIIPVNAHAGIGEILCKGVTALIRFIGDGIETIIGPDWLNSSMDKLVFNVDGFATDSTVFGNYNLSLLKESNGLTTALFKIYDAMVIIGGSLLGIIALFITFDFIRSANEPRHKAVLKSRLKRLLATIVLITGFPFLFDILLVINQTILDIFRLLALDVAGSSTKLGNSMLLDTFKKLSEGDKTNIILALLYVMAGVMNLWLVVFYMMRDLAISILFIIAPIIMVFLPYKTDLIMRWLKELMSNIFTQSIQAFLIMIVLVLGTTIKGENTFYPSVFTFVAFASTIPLTGQIKKILGLEGEIGASKSNTGVGAVIAAAGVGAMAFAGAKNMINGVSDGVSAIHGLKSEERLMKKSSTSTANVGGMTTSVASKGMSGLSSGIGGVNSSASGDSINDTIGSDNSINNLIAKGRGIEVNPLNRTRESRNHGVDTNGIDNNNVYSATSRARQIQGMKSQARKQIAKSVLGGVGSMATGALFAGATSVLGNPNATLSAGFVGSSLGESIGQGIGGIGSNIGSYVSEQVQDIKYGDGVRYDGEQNSALKNVFEGTVSPRSVSDLKHNFETVKSNYTSNKDIIKSNKFAYDTMSDRDRLQSLGVDPSNLSDAQVTREIKAVLARNRYERRGLFSQANYSYAKNTFDRNSVVPNQEHLQGQLESPKLNDYNNGGTPNAVATINSDSNLHQADISKIDELNKSLQEHMNEYMNNSQYINALNQCADSTPVQFTSSDNSQLC